MEEKLKALYLLIQALIDQSPDPQEVVRLRVVAEHVSDLERAIIEFVRSANQELTDLAERLELVNQSIEDAAAESAAMLEGDGMSPEEEDRQHSLRPPSWRRPS